MLQLICTSKVRADFIHLRERKKRIEKERVAMKSEGVRKNILGFMYAERLKSALIIAGQLLDVLAQYDRVLVVMHDAHRPAARQQGPEG